MPLIQNSLWVWSAKASQILKNHTQAQYTNQLTWYEIDTIKLQIIQQTSNVYFLKVNQYNLKKGKQNISNERNKNNR